MNKKEFIIKDNAAFGLWDWDVLANEWNSTELDDWGVDVWQNSDDVISEPERETEEKEIKHKIEITLKNNQEKQELYKELVGREYDCKII